MDVSFALFVEHLSASYGVVDEVNRAERQLRALRQTGSASSYYTIFNNLATLLNWGDAALRSQFYEGLKSRVKDQLANVDKPDTLESMKNLAIRIDNRLFERDQERKYESTPAARYTTPFAPRPTIPPPVSTGPIPMDIDAVNARNPGSTQSPRGPISIAERQRRRNNNLCLYCGNPGHSLANCSLRPDNRAKTQTSELNLSLNDFNRSDLENFEAQ